MTYTKILGCLLIVLFTSNYMRSQTDNNSCEERINLITKYIVERTDYPDWFWNNLYEGTLNCPTSNIDQEYAKKMLKHKVNSALNSTLFETNKKYAEYGVIEAMLNTAFMYKIGRGTRQNLDKSFTIYKRLSNLGNEKAKFYVGYFYFKGLGSVPQDYSLAYKYFQNNSNNLAKHYAAISKFYGFGTVANETLGKINLKENYLANSHSLAERIKSLSTPQTIENESQEVTISNITGTWRGALEHYDYSNTRRLEIMPVRIHFNVTSELHRYKYFISLNSSMYYSISGFCNFKNGKIYFDNLKLNLKRAFSDNPNNTKSEYQFDQIDLFKLTKTSLRGMIHGHSIELNEPSNPILINLFQREVVFNPIEQLSRSENSMIKLHPNPFKGHLTMSFEQQQKGNLSITINDMYGLYKKTLLPLRMSYKGNKNYFFDTTDIPKGLYVVTVCVDQEKYQEIIIKD